MKLKLFTIIMLALLVASCTREPFRESGELEKGVGETVTISVSISPETRVAYTDSDTLGSGGRLSWQVGDKLLLAGYDGTTFMGSEIFEWDAGDRFTGTTVPGATTYKAYYPGEIIMLDGIGNIKPFTADFWQQTQNGDNSAAHLRNKLLLFDETANAITETFNLTLKSSIIRFKLKGVPADVGSLRALVWTMETGAEETKSMLLSVNGITFSATMDSLTAFLAFDPTVTGIAANGEVRITLLGDQLYKWSTTSTGGKNYIAGNRYRGTVSSGWAKMPQTPLQYVAEYNINPGGSGFVTSKTDCTLSGYFTYDHAEAYFTTKTIDYVTYHLPSLEEWRGVVPEWVNTVYVGFYYNHSYTNISESAIVAGTTYSGTSDFRQISADKVTYALRFKDSDIVSAWRYQYVSDGMNTHMKITSRNVYGQTLIIDNIAKESYWSSNTSNDYERYFPASGYKYDNQTWPLNQGSSGYFWSSTPGDGAFRWHMYFDSYYARTSTYRSFNGLSVRLFAPGT